MSKGQLKKKMKKEKLMWNFHGSWFMTLEVPPGGVTQFCKIPRGESLFTNGKVTNLKIQDFFPSFWQFGPKTYSITYKLYTTK